MMLLAAVNGSGANQTTITNSAFTVSEPSTQQEFVQAYVVQRTKDIPVLAEIAKCESQFRQFGTNGQVLHGEKDKRDVGVFQINTGYHKVPGLMTLEGNVNYAIQLYKDAVKRGEDGTQYWTASKPCWKHSTAAKELAKKLALK